MKKLFDESGNEIPNEDIAYLALRALSQLKRENKEKLYERVIEFINKVSESPLEFGREQAVHIVMMIEEHDAHAPFRRYTDEIVRA